MGTTNNGSAGRISQGSIDDGNGTSEQMNNVIVRVTRDVASR
jgi:hypothetical protein